jgi:3-hydroxybutyryl-CoA dehydrogenase
MRLGASYPEGPLEWADRIGLAHVVAALRNLRAAYGEDRYRVPVLISRNALTGRPLRDGEHRG